MFPNKAYVATSEEKKREDELSEFEKYDYIQLMIYDVHCRPVGRMFSREKLVTSKGKGIVTSAGLCYHRIDGQTTFHPCVRNTYRLFRPIMSTLAPCRGQQESEPTIGRVLCDLECMDGTIDKSTPRTAAFKQLSELKDMGYVMKSAFETEFILRDRQPAPSPPGPWHYSSMNHLDENMTFFLELLKELKQLNIPAESLQSETNHGFFEVTLHVMDGLEAADGTALFKNRVKSISKHNGYIASFMSKDDETSHYGLGSHFNHSLWTQDGVSAFLDSTKEDQLSDVARHWIAGLVKHGPAITALCSPTVNCYRRLGWSRLPSRSDWALEDKEATFVVHKTRGDNLYIEDRLPSSASNPYLVMAATVAAGLDGLKNKLPLPAKDAEFCQLPGDLETALTFLQTDTAIVEALGKDFIELFVSNKTCEINLLKSMGQNSEMDSFQHEYNLYYANA